MREQEPKGEDELLTMEGSDRKELEDPLVYEKDGERGLGEFFDRSVEDLGQKGEC